MRSKYYYEESIEKTVLFHELDPLNIVWHGNYYRYFEAGRSHFCRLHQIDVEDFYRAGIFAPISRSEAKYRHSLKYHDEIIIKTLCYYSTEPKLVFHYKIYKKEDNLYVCYGKTEQLFVNSKGELLLEQPKLIQSFFNKMKTEIL